MKTLFLLHKQLKDLVSIEDSKIREISQSTLGPYFEIFWLCIPITENPVFRQLVSFDMLSHISTLLIKVKVLLYYNIHVSWDSGYNVDVWSCDSLFSDFFAPFPTKNILLLLQVLIQAISLILAQNLPAIYEKFNNLIMPKIHETLINNNNWSCLKLRKILINNWTPDA